MKMNEFMTALQTHLTTQQPNYPKLGRKVGLRIFYPLYRGR